MSSAAVFCVFQIFICSENPVQWQKSFSHMHIILNVHTIAETCRPCDYIACFSLLWKGLRYLKVAGPSWMALLCFLWMGATKKLHCNNILAMFSCSRLYSGYPCFHIQVQLPVVKPILVRELDQSSWTIWCVVALRDDLQTALAMELVFITVTTLRMLASPVRVCTLYTISPKNIYTH